MKFGIRILVNLAAALAIIAIPAVTCRGAAINVDVISGTVYNGTAAAPDAGTKWNAISGLGTLTTVYDSQTNLQSGVTVTCTSSSGTSHIYNDTSTGNPTPSALMSAYTYSATYTLAVSNLAPNQAYILYTYSHGNADNQTGTVTFGAANGGASASTSQTGNSSSFRDIYLYGQGYDYVMLNGTSDSLGTITFSVVNYLNGFQLLKVSAPVISGLSNQTAYIGNTVVLNPTVTGFPTPSVQWLQNGVTMPGQTNSPLTLAGVQPALNGNVYSLIASNSLGAVTNSMTLTVSATAPVLPAQTLNVNVVKNSGTHYTGTGVASDTGTYWNNFVVPASNTSTLLNVSNSFTSATTDSVTFTQSSGNFNVYEDASAANGNPLPVTLMEDYIFNGGYTVTVSNLVQGTYTLFAFAHGNATGQGSTITVNAANRGASGTTTDTGYYRDIFQNNAAGNSYLALTGIVGSSGTFSFTAAYLNGFQLQLLTAPIVIGPTNQTVIAGTTALVSPLVVTGVPPPSCQWFSNSVAIAGATNASLTLNNVQYAQNGTVYAITAGNPAGTVTSLMNLSVIVTPGITGLNNQTVSPGATVTMAPTVTGVPTPIVYWLLNGNNLSDGATGNGFIIAGSATGTLNITNAQMANSGTYSLVASNSAGLVTNSMALTVSSGTIAPAITGPTNQTVVQSNNATFVTSVTGLPVPALQWFMNGTTISGATGASLTLTNVLYSQNGYAYSLVASNSTGMATNSATLTVLVPPTISQQPTNLTVVTGGPASFSVAASGVPAVSYQWTLNGSAIAGATGATYSIASVQGSNNGAVFSVTVSNSVAVVKSSNAKLTVLTAAAEAFLPTNGAVNISPDQQLRIVFPGPPQLGSGKLYVYNAANNSIFVIIDTSQFQTFSLWSATITNAEVRVQEGESTYYMPIAIYGNQIWITLTNQFAYGGRYYVNCDSGLFLDASNNVYPSIAGTNTWQFSIAASGPATPTASTGPTNITVGLDGSGNFATLQGAANWIPQNNTLPRTITVLPGTYRDFTVFGQNRNNVMIVGAGANQAAVQFIYPYPSYSSGNDVGFGDLRLESSNIYVRNLTLDNQVYFTNNGVVFAGPINTVYTSGSKLVFDNVTIKGGQDTLYTDSGITYFNHCEIWGDTDFIYGGALSVFDQCNIVQIRSTGGPCTAPSTPYAQPYGLTFLNCTFPQVSTTNGYPYNVGNATTTFMRPWGQDGMTAIINCQVGNQVSTAGWGTFGNTNEDVCRAREYGTTLIGGGLVNVPQVRWNAGSYWVNTLDPDYTNNPSLAPTSSLLAPPTGTNNRVIVTVNTNNYSLPAIYTNSYFALNGWLPTVIPTITTQPANQVATNGETATFSVVATAQPLPVFQWLKNGILLSGQTNTTLIITNVNYGSYGGYSVIVSNSAGTVASSNAWLLVSTKPAPPLPNIPSGTNNVLGFGALGDGITTNTAAIQAAINAASLAGGGTVEIPPGIYLSGPLILSNSINLQIDAGATLQMLPYGSFPATSDFISSTSLHDVEVSGGGTIDGQGAVWWATNNAIAGGISRPKTMVAATTCTNFCLRGVTLQNPPNTHSSFRSVCQNVTVDGITINTTNPSPNTDGIDCSAANVLIENSSISDGDDHIAMGDGNFGNLCHDITIENCLFGNGHGVSIGSFTTGGLSNLLVLDCVWTNGGTGIKVKSDVDRGGLMQNLQYINLAMTNTEIPICFFGYYTNGGTANGVTFAQAANYPVLPVQNTTPIYNNILVSNLTAVPASGYYAGIVWGRPEMCISNVVFDHVNISASKYFNVYNARGIQFIDSQITATTTTNFGVFNAALIISNRSASANFNLVDGLATNGYGNSLSFYNAQASLSDTNELAGGPVSVSAGTFTVSNNLAMTPVTAFNFSPGTSPALVAVKGNLQLGGTVNISAGFGFTNGNYPLLTYGGSLTGTLPILGNVPSGFNYSLNTNAAGQVKLVVSPPVNGNPTNLMYQISSGISTSGVLDVSWPSDHTGWRLQIQTNSLAAGLGTNWFDVAGATSTNQVFVPIDSRNGSVFLRLVYP